MVLQLREGVGCCDCSALSITRAMSKTTVAFTIWTGVMALIRIRDEVVHVLFFSGPLGGNVLMVAATLQSADLTCMYSGSERAILSTAIVAMLWGVLHCWLLLDHQPLPTTRHP